MFEGVGDAGSDEEVFDFVGVAVDGGVAVAGAAGACLLYTSPSPRDS